MDRHPIEGIMTTTLESIRDMIDVNTVVGEPIATSDGSTVIPISRVSFGFLSGGGEYALPRPADPQETPFAGGSGAGVSVQPMGFLIIHEGQIRMAPAQYCAPIDHVMELIPQLLSEIKRLFPSEEKKSPY